jgi:hypothetical protein
MILEDREEHRGYDVIFASIIARRNTIHGKLKGSHKMKKKRAWRNREGSERFQSVKGMGG